MLKKIILVLMFSLMIQNAFGEMKKGSKVEGLFDKKIEETLKKTPVNVVNFWATWCMPCLQEIPALIEISKSEKDVAVIFINEGESDKTVQKFLKRFTPAFESHLDADNVYAEKLGFSTVPYTFLISKDLVILEVLRGNHTKDAFLKKIKSVSK